MQQTQDRERASEYVRSTFHPKQCKKAGCEAIRFSDLGMEFHHLRDH